ELRDVAEDSGKAARRVTLLTAIGGIEQNIADRVAGRCGHFLSADDKHKARAAGGDRIGAGMDRGRSGGTGVLYPGRGLESQVRMRVEREGRREGLLLEAAKVAHIDGLDILEGNAGMRDGFLAGAGNQRFEAFILELAEPGMRPANDRGHRLFLSYLGI